MQTDTNNANQIGGCLFLMPFALAFGLLAAIWALITIIFSKK